VNGYKGALHQRYNSYEEAKRAFLQFWENSEVGETSNNFQNQRSVVTASSASSSTSQSSPRQAPIPNEGGARDEFKIQAENIIYVLALAVLMFSLLLYQMMFG